MKLNPDCVRDVLFTVEKHSTFSQSVEPKDFVTDGVVQKYGEGELLYHIREASMAGLLTDVEFYMAGFIIKDLSPAGHDFLADIRSNTNWAKTKKIAASAGSFSLKAMIDIAKAVVTAAIQSNLHLG